MQKPRSETELDKQVEVLRAVYEQRLKMLLDCAVGLMRAQDAWDAAHSETEEAFSAWIKAAEDRAMREEEADIVTVTVMRGEVYLSVELSIVNDAWTVNLALDEDGDVVVLTSEEALEAITLAEAGVDETGRDD
jgi:hypothetical protein